MGPMGIGIHEESRGIASEERRRVAAAVVELLNVNGEGGKKWRRRRYHRLHRYWHAPYPWACPYVGW